MISRGSSRRSLLGAELGLMVVGPALPAGIYRLKNETLVSLVTQNLALLLELVTNLIQKLIRLFYILARKIDF